MRRKEVKSGAYGSKIVTEFVKNNKMLRKRLQAIMLAFCVTVTSVNLPSIPVSAEDTQENVVKSWSFDTDVQGWEYAAGWEYKYQGASNSNVTFDDEMLKVDLDYSADVGEGYSKAVIKHWESGLLLEGVNKAEWDLYYNPSSMSTGSFNMEVYTDHGSASSAIDFSKATKISEDYYKLHVSMNFAEPLEGATYDQVAIQVIGSNTDFKGSFWFDNIVLSEVSESDYDVTILKSWPFATDEEGWEYGTGWEYQYDGTSNSSVSFDTDKLKVVVDYSGNVTSSWSQIAVTHYEEGMSLKGLNNADLDFYYDTACMTTGGFSIKIYTNDGDATLQLDLSQGELVEGTIYKLPVNIAFANEITSETLDQVALQIIGVNTDYKGALWLDNIVLSQKTSKEDNYVDATVVATGGANQVNVNSGNLVTTKANGEQETTVLPTEISLVDKDASNAVKQTYAYLKAMGETDNVIFGHQNDTHHKAGSNTLSDSDTYDVTGSYAGVIGMDTLSLTSNEYSAKRYNEEIASKEGVELLPETAAGNVKAAATLTNRNIEKGAIITLSSHMPNFSIVDRTNELYDGVHTYSQYDFSGYSPNVLTGEVMNQILPGGTYNEVFTAYLDMIADYASQVNGAILFRPFHENTGSWFWWGAAFCDPQTYKNVYRYTVEYLRDEKNIHNVIYVYSPGSEASTLDEFAVRYPGDAYVDMIGFDMYNTDPTADGKWFVQFENQLQLVNQFATMHNKIFAVTEVGVASSTKDQGDNQTALHKTGNQDLEWYQKLMNVVDQSDAAYFLVWANFGVKDGYYTPYVASVNEDGTLHGHEMLDQFINFFNDNRSVFSCNQKQALQDLSSIPIVASAAMTKATGYITAPVSSSRILDAVTMTARVNNIAVEDCVQFVLKGEKTVTVEANSIDGRVYTGELSKEILEQLGESNGVLQLTINDETVDEIMLTYNIEPPVEDPFLIDGFENYYGMDAILNKKWTTNKASGCNIALSLDTEKKAHNLGEYGLQFSYTEIEGGWAGATIAKEVDWSSCNALQFYTIPDGHNQLVVIQITANDTVYEVYLNQYNGYKNQTEPMLVTIPFTEFCSRDVSGKPKGGLVQDCGKVASFGLWVNAIDESEAMKDGNVSGTIYYDTITAIESDVTEPQFKLVKNELPSNPSDSGSDNTSGNSTGNEAVDQDRIEDEPTATELTVSIIPKAELKDSKLQTLVEELLQKDKKAQYIVTQVNGTATAESKTVLVDVASTMGAKPGDKVYIYGYNSEDVTLENMNKTTYTVDANGKIAFTAYHDQEYVILSCKVKGEKVVPRAKQAIVQKSCSIEKGTKMYLLPIIKSEYKAKITYKSSNKKIVTVNNCGVIVGKKAGKATITTYIKIGKVKGAYKTVVTVKEN
ncbi:glycosyl hydrolase [Anaerosporobacter faecicola]|uniref:glycosyl hydrolase n=1 Tax=Anaerosporobacter faecicola TaxID=2718714 RepID=UPI00143A30FD|nr:glycosyl hydrolase [Anaerosporobacter faecicola]